MENQKVDNQEMENFENTDFADKDKNAKEPVKCIVRIHDDFITTAMKQDFKECGLNENGSDVASMESIEDEECMHLEPGKINYEK